MNGTQSANKVVTVSSTKMLQAMVGIGILCALLIVLTFEGTKSRIESNRAEALEKAIFKVIPGMVKKRTFQLNQNSSFDTISSENIKEQVVYAGYDENDKLVGLAVEASGIGFADVIRILYGYNPDKQIIVGFYVLESKKPCFILFRKITGLLSSLILNHKVQYHEQIHSRHIQKWAK